MRAQHLVYAFHVPCAGPSHAVVKLKGWRNEQGFTQTGALPPKTPRPHEAPVHQLILTAPTLRPRLFPARLSSV